MNAAAILKTTEQNFAEPTGPLPGELAIITACRRKLDEAIGIHADAVVRLQDAKILSNKLPSLRSQAGAIAAAAFSGLQADKNAAKFIADSIELAERAHMALATLTGKAQAADASVGTARLVLADAVRATTINTAKRAAARYHELAEQMTREVALMMACCERILPVADMSGLYGHHFLASLKVPAAPEQVRLTYQGVQNMDSLDLLLAPHHPRLVKETNVAAALIAHQLQQAGAAK